MMIWAGYVARIGEIRNEYKYTVGKLEVRGDLVVLGADGNIMLKYNVKE